MALKIDEETEAGRNDQQPDHLGGREKIGQHLRIVAAQQFIQETEDAIICFTVGDDQSFRISTYDRTTLKCVHREVHERVSGTALRSVRVVNSGVYFAGWEQQIQHWIQHDGVFERVESFYSIVPEIACIDVREDAEGTSICACGAMGFEVLELSVYPVSFHIGVAHVFDVKGCRTVIMRLFVILTVFCAAFLHLVPRINHPFLSSLSVHAYSFRPVKHSHRLFCRSKNVL